MSYWDSSALVKLYVREWDSAVFRALALKVNRLATGSLTRHQLRTVFRRREAEGVLRKGDAAVLYGERVWFRSRVCALGASEWRVGRRGDSGSAVNGEDGIFWVECLGCPG